MNSVTACNDCGCLLDKCICAQVEEFFRRNGGLMERLALIDTQEFEDAPIDEKERRMQAAGGNRCHGCFFFYCRCSLGLLRKS